MTKKYFFFDIDGTLTTKNPGGDVLPSTYATLDKLRAKGHFVCIATGRAEFMARDAAKMLGMENMVHDGGNGITVNNEIIYIEPLDHEKAVTIWQECVEKDIPYALSLDNTPYRYSHNEALYEGREDKRDFFNIVVRDDMTIENVGNIYKIVVGLWKGEEEKLDSLKLFGYSRYHDDHIFIEPDDKVKGIKDMVKYLGGSFEDVVVFGDGHNDLSMIKAAPISIAMGNAIDEVKEAATFVTKRSDDDGIEYACRHFGWID